MRSFSQLSGGMSGLCHCCCQPISGRTRGASACSVAHDRSLDKSTACARQSRYTRWRTQALCDPAPVAHHRWRCRDAQQEWLSSMATAGRERVSVVCVRVGSIVFVSFNTHTGVVSKDTGCEAQETSRIAHSSRQVLRRPTRRHGSAGSLQLRERLHRRRGLQQLLLAARAIGLVGDVHDLHAARDGSGQWGGAL